MWKKLVLEPSRRGGTANDLRPLVPEWKKNHTALIWMRGDYSSYTEWATKATLKIDHTREPG